MTCLSLNIPFRSGLMLGAALLATFTLIIFPMPSQATQEPEYKITRVLSKDIELRQYATYTVAEVLVPGPESKAGNQAFPILAAYIFGNNKGQRQFAMTAPVTQAAVPMKMEMTAPVTQSAASGGYLVQFVLPKEIALFNAPEPLDVRVHLRTVQPKQVAVIRYSGFWSTTNDNEHLVALQAALHAAQLAWTGEAIYSRYNAPFTPWFMRRNEIWLNMAVQN